MQSQKENKNNLKSDHLQLVTEYVNSPCICSNKKNKNNLKSDHHQLINYICSHKKRTKII